VRGAPDVPDVSAVARPAAADEQVDPFVRRVGEDVPLPGGELGQAVEVRVHGERVRFAAEREVVQPYLIEGHPRVPHGAGERVSLPFRRFR
jgi:hypothetical protein